MIIMANKLEVGHVLKFKDGEECTVESISTSGSWISAKLGSDNLRMKAKLDYSTRVQVVWRRMVVKVKDLQPGDVLPTTGFTIEEVKDSEGRFVTATLKSPQGEKFGYQSSGDNRVYIFRKVDGE